jgi:hypothetical protein
MGLKKNDIFDEPLVKDVLRAMDGEQGMQVPVPDEFVETPLMRFLLKTDALDGASAAALLAVEMTAAHPDAKAAMSLVPEAIRPEVWSFRRHQPTEVGSIFKSLCDLDTPASTRLALAALTLWGEELHTALIEGSPGPKQTQFIDAAALCTCKLLDRLQRNDSWQELPKPAIDAFLAAAEYIAGADPRTDRQSWTWDTVESIQKKRGIIPTPPEEAPEKEAPVQNPPNTSKKLDNGDFAF